jgi:hypothetical protein
VLVRVERPTAIPLESLHGRKDALARALRFTVRDVLPASALGEFSLEAQQGDVRAVFVPLAELQGELDLDGRVNTVLLSVGIDADAGVGTALASTVRQRATLDDVGLTLTVLDDRGVVAVGSAAGLLNDAQARAVTEAAADEGLRTIPVLTYLANTMRRGGREIP